MLRIQHPPRYLQERNYSFKVILKGYLGIDYTTEVIPGDHIVIGMNGKQLEMPDHFFQMKKSAWLQPESLPKQPLKTWYITTTGLEVKLTNHKLPVLYGDPTFLQQSGICKLGIDIFGSAFFMLSRYEEATLPERDNHDRFPATASLAFKEGFLDRPIVDEYIEVLWAAMKQLWPGLKRKPRIGRIIVTCDVDRPFDKSGTNLSKLAISCTGDLLLRHNRRLALLRVQNYIACKRGNHYYDPYHTFNWYMDTCEKAGKCAEFYFISDHPAGIIDGFYNIGEPKILELIQRIYNRGHDIGMHGSYNTYQSRWQIQHERQCLANACKQAGINAKLRGNRQHFLRWDVLQTPDHLDSVGYTYDTSGSFADMPGFRYGTARPFTMWSWQKKAQLRIRQQPLILMECSVISDRYMGLGYSQQAIDMMKELKKRSLRYGGDFTLLWHNCHLTTEQDKVFFTELIT